MDNDRTNLYATEVLHCNIFSNIKHIRDTVISSSYPEIDSKNTNTECSSDDINWDAIVKRVFSLKNQVNYWIDKS